jgi:bifunctional DNase/RNase
MVSDLASLTGGRLENAVIDRYHEHEQIYEAKLHFTYGGGSVELDVRPSDAFAVAVACHAPILVSIDILEKMEVKRG